MAHPLRQNSILCADAPVFADSALFAQQKVRAAIATRTLESCLPKDLEQLPIETLVELREELSNERLRYAVAVHGIVEEFGSVASQGQLESLRNEWRILPTTESQKLKGFTDGRGPPPL